MLFVLVFGFHFVLFHFFVELHAKYNVGTTATSKPCLQGFGCGGGATLERERDTTQLCRFTETTSTFMTTRGTLLVFSRSCASVLCLSVSAQ